MGLDAPPKDFLYMECVEASVDTGFKAAYDACIDTGAKLVIIDSMGMAMEGDSESSSDVMKFYRLYINPLRSLGVAILIIDHQAKMIKGEKFADKDIFG
jgi:RecA-family ATPase